MKKKPHLAENTIKCVNCNTFYKIGKEEDIPDTMQNEEICKKCYKTGKFLTCIHCKEIYHKDNSSRNTPNMCYECGLLQRKEIIMKTDEISNSQNIIDSRDVIKRIEELEDLINDNKELPKKKREDLTEEETELEFLKDLEDQANISNWEYGKTLIRESYFVEYVAEMLVDIGDLPKEIPHYIVIDWEATAENIKADYMTIDFDGVDYLIRA